MFKNVPLIKESANKTDKFFFLKYINLGVKQLKIYSNVKFVDTSSRKGYEKRYRQIIMRSCIISHYCTFFQCHLLMTYFGTFLQSCINEFEIDMKILPFLYQY